MSYCSTCRQQYWCNCAEVKYHGSKELEVDLAFYSDLKSKSEKLQQENKELEKKNDINFSIRCDLQSQNDKLRKCVDNLLFHCMDYNLEEESLALAMEIEKARQTLKEIEGFLV